MRAEIDECLHLVAYRQGVVQNQMAQLVKQPQPQQADPDSIRNVAAGPCGTVKAVLQDRLTERGDGALDFAKTAGPNFEGKQVVGFLGQFEQGTRRAGPRPRPCAEAQGGPHLEDGATYRTGKFRQLLHDSPRPVRRSFRIDGRMGVRLATGQIGRNGTMHE